MLVVPIVWYEYCQKLWLMCDNTVWCIIHTILEFIEIDASTNVALQKKSFTIKNAFSDWRREKCISLRQALDSPLPFPPNQFFCNVERM